MDRLIDINELAEVLHIPTGSIRNSLWRHQAGTTIPPPIRLGRRLRWSQSVVEAWLRSRSGYTSENPAIRTPISSRRGRPSKRAQLARVQQRALSISRSLIVPVNETTSTDNGTEPVGIPTEQEPLS